MHIIRKKIRNLIIFILVLLVAFFLGIRIVGFRPYAIKTTSMEPELMVNDMVYVQYTEFEELSVGDIITYISDNNDSVTHEVIEIDKNNKTVRTKGIKNEYPDIQPVYAENILGKVKFKIPYIGYLTILKEKAEITFEGRFLNG